MNVDSAIEDCISNSIAEPLRERVKVATADLEAAAKRRFLLEYARSLGFREMTQKFGLDCPIKIEKNPGYRGNMKQGLVLEIFFASRALAPGWRRALCKQLVQERNLF